MINISIDAPDVTFRAGIIKMESEINDIESIYEFVAENLFDMDIPESDEEDLEKKVPFTDLIFSQHGYFWIEKESAVQHNTSYYYTAYIHYILPDSPPPKRV